MLESTPHRLLVLQARGWPLGEARVELRIVPMHEGCEVTITEDATHGPGRLVPSRLRQLVLGGRNTETLHRLALLAERHAAPVDDGNQARLHEG